MTTTTLMTGPSSSDGVERIDTTTRVLLIGAPLLMAFARVLLVPLDDDDWGGTLQRMAAHKGRSETGWLFALAACGLLAITATVLCRRLLVVGRVRAARFALIGTALGWVTTAAGCGYALLMSVAAQAPDRAMQAQIMKDFNDGTSSAVAFLFVVLGALGYFVLAFGLARAGLVSRGAAVLIGLGGAATMITMFGPLTILLVLTALLLAAGHALASRAEGSGVSSVRSTDHVRKGLAS